MNFSKPQHNPMCTLFRFLGTIYELKNVRKMERFPPLTCLLPFCFTGSLPVRGNSRAYLCLSADMYAVSATGSRIREAPPPR